MAKQRDTDKDIQDYLSGSMSEEEQRMFEETLSTDDQVLADLSIYQAASKALRNKDAFDFRQQLEEINSKEETTAKTFDLKPKRFRRVLSIAASLLLIAAAVYWVLMPKQLSQTPDELYLAYFVAPENILTFPERNDRGEITEGTSSINIDSIWKEVEMSYQAKKHKEAYKLLTETPEQFQIDYRSEIQYQMGILSLLLDRPPQAISHFDKVTIGYNTSKPWFKALALLKVKGGTTEAKAILEEMVLVTKSTTLKDNAQTILDQLD